MHTQGRRRGQPQHTHAVHKSTPGVCARARAHRPPTGLRVRGPFCKAKKARHGVWGRTGRAHTRTGRRARVQLRCSTHTSAAHPPVGLRRRVCPQTHTRRAGSHTHNSPPAGTSTSRDARIVRILPLGHLLWCAGRSCRPVVIRPKQNFAGSQNTGAISEKQNPQTRFYSVTGVLWGGIGKPVICRPPICPVHFVRRACL